MKKFIGIVIVLALVIGGYKFVQFMNMTPQQQWEKAADFKFGTMEISKSKKDDMEGLTPEGKKVVEEFEKIVYALPDELFKNPHYADGLYPKDWVDSSIRYEVDSKYWRYFLNKDRKVIGFAFLGTLKDAKNAELPDLKLNEQFRGSATRSFKPNKEKALAK